jgi:hypothetical protein
VIEPPTFVIALAEGRDGDRVVTAPIWFEP